MNKELRDTQESIKLQITELAESKQLITDQLVTISKLVAIKNEVKRYKDDVLTREKRIDYLEKVGCKKIFMVAMRLKSMTPFFGELISNNFIIIYQLFFFQGKN